VTGWMARNEPPALELSDARAAAEWALDVSRSEHLAAAAG
jgi:hypothetical protein